VAGTVKFIYSFLHSANFEAFEAIIPLFYVYYGLEKSNHRFSP